MPWPWLKAIPSNYVQIEEVLEVAPPMDPHEALIEEIRKEEFGIDVILSEDGQKLMEKQKQRLGRSLDRLSKVGLLEIQGMQYLISSKLGSGRMPFKHWGGTLCAFSSDILCI